MKTTLDPSQREGRLEASLARERAEEREAPDPLWTLVAMQTLVERVPLLPSSPSTEAGEAAPEVEHGGNPPPSGAPAPDETLTADHGASTSGAGRAGERSSRTSLPRELCAEVSDERLGRLALRVVRGQGGLDIVIGVADARVKALIMAEQETLMRSLKDAGLAVVSVQIGASTRIAGATRAGTGLALQTSGPESTGAERPRAATPFRQPAARWRGYRGSPEEEDEDGGEGVDFTA
jgi:hypothetical protein